VHNRSNPKIFFDAYDEEGERLKAEFKRLGMRYFKSLVKRMNLIDSKVSFNPGGIAGSGDFSVMGMFDEINGFHLFFNWTGMCRWVTYRSISALDDYTGGYNRQMDFIVLQNSDNVIEKLNQLRIN